MTLRLLVANVAATAAALTVLLAPSRTWADSGVSDERVSLPDGPGSIGGVGDNIEVDGNMGSMSTTVSIDLPSGLSTATPTLSLNYSSSSGSSELGYGWSLPIPSIERMRMRGLPVYDDTDEIVANGGSELIRVAADATVATYRARFEGGFVRYRWHDRAGGAEGYWTAEYPDGSIGYYGADESGTEIRNARVESSTGEVYRWHLAAMVDVFGNVTRYVYQKDGEYSLISEVAYAYIGMTPRFTVRFGYEARPDPITTGEPGFLLSLTRRMSEIQVRSSNETIRRYRFVYEDLPTSGGATRIARIDQLGRMDTPSPIRFDFRYSRSLDGTCPGTCEGAYMVDMGTLPPAVDLRSGRATLIDMNGDALPDIVETGMLGQHTIVLSTMNVSTGIPSFTAARSSAATPAPTSFRLSEPGVQVLDVNGDGFTDMISSRTGQVLCNNGTGDWAMGAAATCLMNSTLPVLDQDAVGDPNPRHVRFLDYDDDHRIDMIRTVVGQTEVFVNTGADFQSRVVDDIGAQFDDSPTLQLADINGDGLQDPVEILPGAAQLRYRFNLGYGRWTDWR